MGPALPGPDHHIIWCRCLFYYANHSFLLRRAQAKSSNPRSSERLLSQVASNNRPRPATSHTGSGHTPTTHPSTPSASSYSGSLGYLNVDHHSALPVPHTHTVRDTSAEDFAAVKITMAGLGIELPDQVIATLARKHDGMTPMERFLSEEGHWVPDSRSQGNHYKGGSQGGR